MKLIYDLSSNNSSTSESDTTTTIPYADKIPDTGVQCRRTAESRKQNNDLKIKCNRKIKYFLNKYANIHPRNFLSIKEQIYFSNIFR